MRLQNDRNAIRIEIASLFGRAEIYEKERRKRKEEGNREITKETYSDLCLRASKADGGDADANSD